MKNNYALIDHAIYHYPEKITKKIELNSKYLIFGIIGTILLLMSYLIPFINDTKWLFTILSIIGWFGVVTLVCIALYLLIGDCRRLYYKVSGEEMERCEVNYEQNDLKKVCDSINQGNFNNLLNLSRSFVPNFSLVMYKSHDNGIMAAQLIDSRGLRPRPITDIKIFERGEFNLSDSTESLSRLFYK